MTPSTRRAIGLMAGALVLGAAVTGVSGSGSVAADDEAITDNWTRAEALRIEMTDDNTAPLIPDDFPIMTDEVWVWDTWPLTDLEGNVVKVGGYSVIFSLVAPRDIPFPERHWAAEIGYFYSHDGRSWTYGGDLHPGAPTLSDREWAGSAYLIDGTVYSYFTAAGDLADPDPRDPLQRIALATGTPVVERGKQGGVSFTGFDDAQVILEADGTWYQTLEQSEGAPIIYAFRDPWVFRDPNDGQTYMLFEGNTAGDAESQVCDPEEIGDVPPGHVVPEESKYYTGNIGIARMGEGFADWSLEAPILAANCTNQQLERPHLVVRDGAYHLFTISHQFTFAPGIGADLEQGPASDPAAATPDGLYGFVNDRLRGDYQPMNGGGLVIGNPVEAPLQAYSWYVTPKLLAESFIDTPASGTFGGTLAPTLKLQLRGDSSRIVTELDYGVIR